MESIRHDDKDRDLKKVGLKGRDAFIVQLRPASHALDLNIVRAASSTYLALAPTIRPLDLVLPGTLCAYEMEKLDGTPFSRLQPRNTALDAVTHAKLEQLITSFADFVAQGWRCASKLHMSPTVRTSRADSPMDNTSDMLSQCPGKVGSSIIHRLEKMAAELPDACLRERAEMTLAAMQHMTNYPIVLNHGDLIPSNILVDKETWEITALVDWAEAEYLPFGTCLYGLELLLGYFCPPPPASPEADTVVLDTTPKFMYFDNARQLRQHFWTRLLEAAPDLHISENEVRVMRDLGVLLWHGIAWDDGAINRVVNETDDVEELTRLRAFLSES
ncbi:hypothetical protein EJ02DRAFT_449705 [Clathrospora elynae]|uniref:Aminoglycoside phosphotransferase domain-containing protein n=1 Tax=Clathrospora elynae TaxID=706981 RepID=A0A6A5TF45_9PLEO|nr:hypothetical protein EJ02DRAFT_449705 [Clathrospora elynae]